MTAMISQIGTVKSIHAQQIIVKINRPSACDQCHAKSICNGTSQHEHLVSVKTSEKFNIGEKIQLEMEEKTAWIAILYFFILPFTFLLITFITSFFFLKNELTASMLSILSLIFYYLTLYLFKINLTNKIVFIARKINKLED